MNELLNSSLTAGSQKAYQRAWTCYRQFHARFYSACETHLIPVSIDALALFISYLSSKQFAVATIHSYVSAIGYVHRLRGIGDPTKSFLIQKLLTATSRNRVSDIRLPISRPLLHQLVSSLSSTHSSAAQRKRYAAMFTTAFYGFFRIGELAAKNVDSGGDVLQYDDLCFISSNGRISMAKLTIRKFKHNTANKAFEILIARENSVLVCPVQTLLDYCGMRGAAPGPLFCESDLRPVTISSFNTALKRCLVFCGLDTSRYKGHSFRIGAATHASEQGFSDSQIRRLGRWQSDAFKSYLRSGALSANAQNDLSC